MWITSNDNYFIVLVNKSTSAGKARVENCLRRVLFILQIHVFVQMLCSFWKIIVNSLHYLVQLNDYSTVFSTEENEEKANANINNWMKTIYIRIMSLKVIVFNKYPFYAFSESKQMQQ